MNYFHFVQLFCLTRIKFNFINSTPSSEEIKLRKRMRFTDLHSWTSMPLAKRDHFPSLPCVYGLVEANGTIAYIGRTGNLLKRWRYHHMLNFFTSSERLSVYWCELQSYDVQKRLESRLIKAIRPSYNWLRVSKRAPLVPATTALPSELHQEIVNRADVNGRTISQEIRYLVTQGLRVSIQPDTPARAFESGL